MKKILFYFAKRLLRTSLILSLAGLQLINCSEQINSKFVEQNLTKEQQEALLRQPLILSLSKDEGQANKMLLDAVQKKEFVGRIYSPKEFGNLEKVKKAIASGADVNTKNELGYTTLMLASYCGLTDIIELLIKAGADVNAKDNHGSTALTWASMNGHTDIVELLIKAGADVNTKNKNDRTPLMLASRYDYKDTVELLVLWAPYSQAYYEDKVTDFKKYITKETAIKSQLNPYLITDLCDIVMGYLEPNFQDWMNVMHRNTNLTQQLDALAKQSGAMSSSCCTIS